MRALRLSIVSKLYAIAGIALVAVIAIGIWLQHSKLPDIESLLGDDSRLVLQRPLFRIAGQPVTILFLIKTFVFLLFLNLLARGARQLLGSLVKHNARIDNQRQYVLSKAVTFTIYVVGIVVGIQVENINLTALALVGGTLGLGVGFGLQTLVSNFVAGLILLIEQPIRLGDRIEFGDKSGEVVRVGSRSSSLRTYDNAILIIPNSDYVTKQILNWTASDPKIKRTVQVSVAYGTDPREVIQTLLELADKHADVMKNPAPAVELSDLGMHAMTFSLAVWTLIPPEKFERLKSDLYLAILERFKEEKIEMPFPQLDLHVTSIAAPISISQA